ncbi:hypothetical protein OAA41_00500 [bacterium]|jgi:hypothetical protein|nr:hypothetical protein [bacterium]
MGLLDKSKKVKQQIQVVEHQRINKDNLTKAEIQFLLKLIGQSAFQGKDVQVIYDITAKLQNQYTR